MRVASVGGGARCCVPFGYEPSGGLATPGAVYILWLSGVKLPTLALKVMGFQSNANGCLNYVTEVAYVPMVAEIGCYAVHG